MNMARGDRLDGPINRLDKICLKHDLSYHSAGNNKTKKQTADREMVRSIDALNNKMATEKLVRSLINNKKVKFGL